MGSQSEETEVVQVSNLETLAQVIRDNVSHKKAREAGEVTG